MWRVVLEGKASLHELETCYSIDDLADLNDAIDAWAEAMAKANKAR